MVKIFELLKIFMGQCDGVYKPYSGTDGVKEQFWPKCLYPAAPVKEKLKKARQLRREADRRGGASDLGSS